MRLETQVDGNIDITENSQIWGLVRGDVEIASKIDVQLHGMVFGNVCVSESANLSIHGLVTGDVRSIKGTVIVFGHVMGTISHEP